MPRPPLGRPRQRAALDALLDQVFPGAPLELQRSCTKKRTRVLQLEVVETCDASIGEALLREAENELQHLNVNPGRYSDKLVSLALRQIGVARGALELRRKWLAAEGRKDRASA